MWVRSQILGKHPTEKMELKFHQQFVTKNLFEGKGIFYSSLWAWYTVLRIIPQIPAPNKQFYYSGLANELFGQLNTLASKHIFILLIGTKIIQAV